MCGPRSAQLEMWDLMEICKCKQLFRLLKRGGRCWRREGKPYGINKTELLAQESPKAHGVPTSGLDKPTFLSFEGSVGCQEVFELDFCKPSVALLITLSLSSVKQATTSCSVSVGSFKILIKRPQLNRKDTLGELTIFPWPSVPISRCCPRCPLQPVAVCYF